MYFDRVKGDLTHANLRLKICTRFWVDLPEMLNSQLPRMRIRSSPFFLTMAKCFFMVVFMYVYIYIYMYTYQLRLKWDEDLQNLHLCSQ